MENKELFNNKTKEQPAQRQPMQLGLYDAANENVHVGSALGEGIKLFVDAALEHNEGHQNGQEHCGNRGELIECHVDALGLVNQTGTHVDNDEYQEREQRETIRFLVVQGIAHIGFLLFSSKAC